MSTSLLEDVQPVSGGLDDATSERSAKGVLEDGEGFEVLGGESGDVDWSLLDLPEQVLRRWTSGSCGSLM